MDQVVFGHILNIGVVVIGYFLVRMINKADDSITKLNNVVIQMQLDNKEKVTWQRSTTIAQEEAKKALTEHLLTDHRN